MPAATWAYLWIVAPVHIPLVSYKNSTHASEAGLIFWGWRGLSCSIPGTIWSAAKTRLCWLSLKSSIPSNVHCMRPVVWPCYLTLPLEFRAYLHHIPRVRLSFRTDCRSCFYVRACLLIGLHTSESMSITTDINRTRTLIGVNCLILQGALQVLARLYIQSHNMRYTLLACIQEAKNVFRHETDEVYRNPLYALPARLCLLVTDFAFYSIEQTQTTVPPRSNIM